MEGTQHCINKRKQIGPAPDVVFASTYCCTSAHTVHTAHTTASGKGNIKGEDNLSWLWNLPFHSLWNVLLMNILGQLRWPKIHLGSICWKVHRREVNVVLQKQNQTNAWEWRVRTKQFLGNPAFNRLFSYSRLILGWESVKWRFVCFPITVRASKYVTYNNILSLACQAVKQWKCKFYFKLYIWSTPDNSK